MSLRTRLLVGLVALTTLGLLAADAATYTSLRSYLYRRVDVQLEAARFPVLRSLLEGRPDARFPERPGGPPGASIYPAGTYGELRASTGEVVGQTVLGTADVSDAPRPKLPSTLPGSGGSPVLRVFNARAGSLAFRVRAEPLIDGSGTLVVAIPLHETQQTLGRLLLVELAVGALVLFSLALLAWWVVRLGLRPLEHFADTASLIAEGDLTQRVEHADERTEVGRLGHALNQMLAQIEQAFAERTASENRLRRFLADASHELRTPLTSIRGYAELFRRGANARPDDLAKAMSRIEGEAQRMGILVEDLLLLARLDQGRPLERAPVDLASIATDAVEDARARDPGRPIALDAPEELLLLGDDTRLRQVAANLLTNALTHTPSGSPVEVSVRPDGAYVDLVVTDHGPGMEQADAERVFERFYRSDPSRTRGSGGTGIGLSIVAAIAEAHGGSVSVDTAPGSGASFRVRLPFAPAA